MTLYPKLILDALATVRYPGTGKNLVEAEMVADNLRIDGMTVSFSLIFDRRFATTDANCRPITSFTEMVATQSTSTTSKQRWLIRRRKSYYYVILTIRSDGSGRRKSCGISETSVCATECLLWQMKFIAN